MKLIEARARAQALVEQIAPHCERVQIAGSIRRRTPEVKDIEIVLIPRWEDRVRGDSLFGEKERVNALHADWATRQPEGRDSLIWIKPATDEVIRWSVKADGQYWRGILPLCHRTRSGIKVDLFLSAPSTWGIDLVIRTGSAEFSKAVVTRAKRLGRPCIKGTLTQAGLPLPTPEEESVFELLGLAWVDPEHRTGFSALRGV